MPAWNKNETKMKPNKNEDQTNKQTYNNSTDHSRNEQIEKGLLPISLAVQMIPSFSMVLTFKLSFDCYFLFL